MHYPKPDSSKSFCLITVLVAAVILTTFYGKSTSTTSEFIIFQTSISGTPGITYKSSTVDINIIDSFRITGNNIEDDYYGTLLSDVKIASKHNVNGFQEKKDLNQISYKDLYFGSKIDDDSSLQTFKSKVWRSEKLVNLKTNNSYVNSLNTCLSSETFTTFSPSQSNSDFKSTCGWWLQWLEVWKDNLSEKTLLNELYALQERSGTGDRMAGAVTALFFALQRNLKLKVQWTMIDAVFKPSCLFRNQKGQKILELSGQQPTRYVANQCLDTSYYSCSYLDRQRNNCPIYNRACIPPSHCTDLRSFLPNNVNMTMTHLIGCPLRMMFDPVSEFLDHEISWFIDGSFVNGTLKELTNEMNKYITIAVHLRLGDGFMTHNFMQGDPDTVRELDLLKKTRTCINSVTDYVTFQGVINNNPYYNNMKQIESNDVDKYISYKNNKQLHSSKQKEIKWIIASDDGKIRNYFEETFPDKVIILKSRPYHIQRIKHDPDSVKLKEIRDLFSEWYIIGKADHLIANRAHRFGVSAFSRSSWIYNLKSRYYEVKNKNDMCLYREFQYEGNSETVNKACQTQVRNVILDQHHIDLQTALQTRNETQQI